MLYVHCDCDGSSEPPCLSLTCVETLHAVIGAVESLAKWTPQSFRTVSPLCHEYEATLACLWHGRHKLIKNGIIEYEERRYV